MRTGSLGPRQTAAGALACSPLVKPRRAGLPLILCAVALGALAGCEAHIPMPDSALLRPQPPPRCDRKAETDAAAASRGDEAALKRLDYEAQCYRHAEMIARSRLGKLQDSIRESAKAGKQTAAVKP